MKRILFQGDSITDAGRNKEDGTNNKGFGYATLVAAKLGYEYPGEYEILNRGIGGHRIVDIYARIKQDIINLRPDYMSLLIGINDVAKDIECNNGVCAEKFEKIYNMLLEEIREALPDIGIMILEPFVLRGSETEKNWETYKEETQKRAEVSRRVAEKNDAVFVPLMNAFEEAARKNRDCFWTPDGVHPTPAGHELIKRAWLEGFEKIR